MVFFIGTVLFQGDCKTAGWCSVNGDHVFRSDRNAADLVAGIEFRTVAESARVGRVGIDGGDVFAAGLQEREVHGEVAGFFVKLRKQYKEKYYGRSY